LHRSKARACAGAPRSIRPLWPDTSERPGLRKRRMWRLRREKPSSAVVRIDRNAPLRRERLGAERPGALQEPWRPHHGTAAIAMKKAAMFDSPDLCSTARLATTTDSRAVP